MADGRGLRGLGGGLKISGGSEMAGLGAAEPGITRLIRRQTCAGCRVPVLPCPDECAIQIKANPYYRSPSCFYPDR